VELRVLQWNVWVEEPIDRIIEELRHIDADVYCLQELTTDGTDAGNGPARLAEGLGLNVHFYAPPRSDYKGVPTVMGNAVCSRHPLAAERFVILRPTGGEGLDRGRVYVEAAVETTDGVVTVGSTHLSYIHAMQDSPAKREEIEALIAATGPDPSRLIVTGDFNATPETTSMQRMSEHLTDAGPDSSNKTWTTKPYSDGDFKADSCDWRLDYVFMSSDAVALESRVVDSRWSDHRPVFARIKFR
jgi:endonuclease/exonuclease/phosphatase family metal-dependent hydrolase